MFKKRQQEFSATKIVVGLGNPGTNYAKTFHNLGFLAVERLAVEMGLKFKNIECKAVCAVGYVGGVRVVVAKPQTYMNLSGESVRELLGKYRAVLSDLLVVYDDIDLPRAAVRVREKGGAGTHNGMKSIVSCVGSGDFPRVRIGAGSPPPEIPLADYVLMNIPQNWHAEFNIALNSAASAAHQFLNGTTIDAIMREHNSAGKPSD